MDEPKLGVGQVHPKSGQWEFGVAADFDFAELSRTMRFVGTMMIIFGVVSCLGAIYMAIEGKGEMPLLGATIALVNGVVGIVLGIWTRSASDSFHLITQTEGSDLDHLMQAVKDLRRIYKLQYVLYVIAIALLVISLLASLLLVF